jgi:formamidopyrimidine-DNA glycosylase
MPELPETETIARDLDTLLRHRVVRSVTVVRRDVLRGVTPRALDNRLRGARIERAWRRAKAVVLDLSTDERLVIVPRFTGAVVVDQAAEKDKYAVVCFVLDDGGRFAYRDVRRLGTMSLLSPTEFQRLDVRLGVEPLDESFTVGRLSGYLRSSKQSVKKILMDQRRIAGVGNIYANEALWLACIDPSRQSLRLELADVAKLRDAVVRVLTAAVAHRGTTFRDYRDARGEPGGFVSQLAVYGRGGQPCLRCGTRLAETHAVDGRSTVFCFRCQQ